MEWKGTGDGSWSERNQWSCLSIKLWQCHAWLFATLDPRAFFSEGLSSCTFLSFNSHHSMELCVCDGGSSSGLTLSLSFSFDDPFHPLSLLSLFSPQSRQRNSMIVPDVTGDPRGCTIVTYWIWAKTINRHQPIPQRWHCSHTLDPQPIQLEFCCYETTKQVLEVPIPAYIKEIKCNQGSCWQYNYKHLQRKKKKERKRKRILLLALSHASRWLGTAAAAWGFFLILLGISRNDVRASNVLVLVVAVAF